MTKIGQRNANYWINAVAEGGEDYYTKPGEGAGQWMGELAGELGLSGEVSRAQYTALLAGKDPTSGKVLVRRLKPRTYLDATGRERRVEPILGYDIRFSAPKSISLLWAVGTEEVQARIERGHDYAIGEALGYLERHACFVQRGKGGARIEPGAGFVSMSFMHRSSRAGDPALHSHLVTANMTRSVPDGSWLSLANPKRQSPLLREAKTAGYVFQAAYREFLTRELGVGWEQVVNGHADIAGIGREVIEHFSQRRAEILAAMAERGTSSSAAAEIAAYRTREAKDYGVDPDRQREEWRARAAEFSLTADSIDQMVAPRRGREPRPIRTADLDAALGQLEAKHSHFDRRELLCAVADQMREGATAAQLEGAVDHLLASERVVEIYRGEGPFENRYFTTPRLWAMEQEVLAFARGGEDAGAAVVNEATLAGVLARHRYLSAEQAEMVRRLTTGGERLICVAALPGSGKTTALDAAREAWASAGIPGLGVATARTASGELGDAGLPATSITALLIRCEEAIAAGKRPLPPGTVIVVDEASTAATPEFAALVALVKGCDGKLVTIGDPRQIGAVGPGGLYGQLTAESEPVRLREIRRQREPVDRRIVELAHQGQGSDALDLLSAHERLVIADTHLDALDALALDWHERFLAGEDAVMIARRGRDVAELNERARALQAAKGRLGERHVSVAGQQFAVGDRLITRVNTPQVSNRERWEVTGIDRSGRYLKLRHLGADGRSVVLSPEYLNAYTENGEPAVQHAYALTTYATQSKTFDSAFALLDAGISREDFVVAVSRARGTTTAYGIAATDLLDPELGPAAREISDAAHDMRVGSERVAGEFSATQIVARKRIEGISAFELAERREQIERRLDAADSTHQQERIEALERRIDKERGALSKAKTQRANALADEGDSGLLPVAESKGRLAAKQLRQLEQERRQIVESLQAEGPQTLGASRAERAELALIEDRLLLLRRREAQAERMSPSELVMGALGDRPSDPEKALRWNEGLDLILSYRQRNRITARDPLGPRPTEAKRLRERQEAEMGLRRIQQALGLERAGVLEQGFAIER